MIKLRDLAAEFIRLTPNGCQPVETLAAAQGIVFLCPKCYQQNDGPVGTHRVMCWFAGRDVPPDTRPLPGRWNPSGTCMDDLSFVGPGAASVLLEGGCGWHGFVKSGCAA